MSVCKKFWHSFICVLLVFTSQAYSCDFFLASTSEISATSFTDNFIAYVSTLLEEQTILPSYLDRLTEDLKNNQPLTNPFDGIHTKPEHSIHQINFNHYLHSHALDKNKLMNWLQRTKEQKNKTKAQKDKTAEQTKDPSFSFFHKINSGSFSIPDPYGVTQTYKIEQDFSMMDIPVTQRIWATVTSLLYIKKIIILEFGMLLLPPLINDGIFNGDGRTMIQIHGHTQELKPEHPVTWVTWDEVKEFIKNLNKLSLLDDDFIQAELIKLFAGHQRGDIYDLPTLDQWKYVATNMGHANEKYFDKADNSGVPNYAWYIDNSNTVTYYNHSTQDVAIRLARTINNHPFYDLEGNVWEYTQNCLEKEGKLHCFVCGGSWRSELEELATDYYHTVLADKREKDVGFRLIRVLK